MIIKRVAIQGFKTYAKKTDFIFDPGVTAVVGPNGSGKSNVADAIRWCLGEQSFSLLRSKKTSDVIFSGSDRKSRLGMAQVTVTLDNSDGELPVDFSEVEITRRAYRDGNNEYLLNGQRVRLQDITEILAPTGLGKRTYALIGQGLIERVLSMTPDDLRTLFEEAAGITAQQAKRTTALRRLDAANQNLTRVKDITAEISPRLGYLRRQAERTEQRNEVAEQLREMLEDWYGFHWHRALRQLAVQKERAATLEKRVEKDRGALDDLSQKVAEQRARQAELRSELAELHSISSVHHRESEQIGRELAVAQERLRQMVARTEANRQELAPLRLERETLIERISSSERKIADLQQAVSQRRASVDALQAQVAERLDDRRKLEEQLEAQRNHVTAVQTTIAKTQSRLQQLEDRLEDLALDRQKTATAQESAQVEVKKVAAELEARRAAHREVEVRIQEIRTQIAAIDTALQESRGNLEDASRLRQEADRDVDRLQTRLDVLNRLQSEGAGFANGVRAVLQQGDRGRLNGVKGTVATVLHVPAELDKAIETALGGAFQNVITRTWTDAQAAIQYLTDSRNGRATFLPLDRLHVLPGIPAPKTAGVLGNASDLVDFDPGVADAVLQLLNRVWVVEDLQTARSALDAIRRGPRPTVVTLRGEIVRPGGAVSGGTDARRRDESILSRQRELRELPKQVERASDVAARQAEVCNQMVAQIEALEQDLRPQRDALEALERAERSALSEVNRLEKELERSTQAEQWHAARAEQIENERVELASQQETLASQGTEAANQLETAQADLRESQELAKESGVEDLQQRLGDLRTAAAEVQGSLESQIAILDNQRRSLQSVESRIAGREQQITALTADSADTQEQIQALRKREQDEARLLAELQAKIDPAEASLGELEQAQSRLETEERTLQTTLRKDETDWNGAQLAMQRAEDLVTRLQHDIEQEFSLVFLDENDDDDDVVVQPILPWDSIVARLEPLEALPEGMDEQVQAMRRRLSRLKNVNPDAPREYAEAAERCNFLEAQAADLEAAIADLHEVISKLDTLMESELQETFDAVADKFIHYFTLLFSGGAAKLSLTDPDNITMSGVEIVARPPGKRPQSLALLSGGERTLAACALIFAILRVSPTPFCVLDEVDAALDEANVDRFRAALEELSQDTQFILITHNRRTLEGTNAIYGVTMGSDGTSRVISLKLEGERIVRGDSEAPQEEGSQEELSEIEEVVGM